MKWITRILQRANVSSDVVMAFVLAAILGAMIIPLPEWLLDAGLALNLAASVSLLVAALYASDPLKVASFPTLLLLTTLFRLALNVSSTRLALSEGHAGQIIQAFGEFVVSGDYVVGGVIFVILTLVQFLVVAKGSERVAEVSARFTLDAMPGKQMAIDADLRSGAIDQAQAKIRRRSLERESQMFGSMDGAMKFVKGDVIAGLIIVLVNLVAGTVLGVTQQALSFSEAAQTYALIAIGDGLVSQIPSLCIALGAGLVVTRVSGDAEESSIGAEIGRQFFGQWKALFVVAGLCAALALVPGMPKIVFLLISAMAFAGGFFLKQNEQGKAEKSPAAQAADAAQAPKPVRASVGVVPMILELSPSISGWATGDHGQILNDKLEQIREHMFIELGVRVPGFQVKSQAKYLPTGSYRILIDEVPRGSGGLDQDGVYALVPASDLQWLNIQAEACTNPVDGKEISKISEVSRAQLMAAEISIRTGFELMLEHLVGLLKRHAARFLGIEAVQMLIREFEIQSPALVKEALGKVPLPLMTEVLKKLAEEEVSIRNLRAILEALVDPTTEGDAVALAERCRRSLQNYFSHRYGPTGSLYAHLVDPMVEEILRAGAGIDPMQADSILEGVKRLANENGKAIILASPDVRRSLRRLIQTAFPQVAVLSYGDLDADLAIRPIGRLTVG